MQAKQASERIQIPKIYHPFINGPNGEVAKALIGDKKNVRINIPPLSVMKDELDDLIDLLKSHQVVIVASFPSINITQTDSQRAVRSTATANCACQFPVTHSFRLQ